MDKNPLLEAGQRDGSIALPALQKLLQLAYSDSTDKQLEAVMGISKMIERHPADASSFGPLCHTLSRLAASEHRAVVAYAARGIKLLVLDDALRPQATVAGIPSVLAAALREWEDDAPCLREILGALQTLCCDKATVLPVVDAGAMGSVLELLDTSNLELRMLSTAIAANVLAFSDSLLLTNEECIDGFLDVMEILLDAIKSRDSTIRDYGLAGLANACAHPVLAGRAKELGAPEILRNFLERNSTETASYPVASSRWRGGRLLRQRVGQRQRVETALARLNGVGFRGGGLGDVEEGGDGGTGKLRFFTFKNGGGGASSNRYSDLADSDEGEEDGEVRTDPARRSPDNSPRALLQDIVANLQNNNGGGSSADPGSSLQFQGGALQTFLASALEEAYRNKEKPADWVLDLVVGTSNTQRKSITKVNPRRLEAELSAENPPNFPPASSDDAPEVERVVSPPSPEENTSEAILDRRAIKNLRLITVGAAAESLDLILSSDLEWRPEQQLAALRARVG
eukprot:g8971.t1